MIDQARKTIEETKKEKNETQLVRRVLNQITPDNYELKKDQLRKLLFEERKTFEELCKEQPKMNAEEKNTLKKEIENSNIDSEKETIVVATIFRKAANEKLFVGFYASLCSDIVRLELQMKGYEPTRVNVRYCSFRTNMLNYCRETFVQMFNKDNEIEGEKDTAEAAEARFKQKEKLFGNINFIGELFKHWLLPEKVIF